MNKARKPFRKRITRKPKSRAPTVSQAVKKYVKKTIHGQIENKCTQINFGNSFGNVLESPDFNAYPLCPLTGFWTINQGLTQGNRIGNQIKTRRCTLSYIIRPTVYDAGFNPVPRPMEVQLMIGFVKNTPSYQPTAFDINLLYQGGSVTNAPIGSLRDLIATINTDYWTIKKRWTHKIGYAAATGTGGQATAQYHSNNDFKYNVMKKIDITKMVPATYQFNDNSITPTSRNLFFMYYAVAANGQVLSNVDLTANIEFWIDYHFEDA